jgi:DNA-binding CsgD family transcriptional regulator
VVAARLGEQHWVAPHLDEAWTLLERLGDPPLWTAPLHWAALQAALAAGDLNTARDHADTLRGIATPSARCAAAFADAAAQWLKLAAGDVDADAAAAAARRLHAAGVCWEGARLAGQAAIRTRDRRAMVALLDCARALQHPRADGEPEPATPAAAPVPAPERPAPRRRAAAGSLSEREGEIARRVLAGLTYKQIGEQLFISPKTVEHHVAQLRRRFGATSRSELFAQLRATLAAGGPAGTSGLG